MLVSLATLALAACTAARINHFKSFAQAGLAYTQATKAVLEEAGMSAIDTDTMVMTRTRDSIPKEERGKQIIEHNKLLRERLALLADLSRHAELLRTYFEALGALAETDAPSGIGSASASVVDSLGKLNTRIASAAVGDFAVSDFAGKIVEIAVARFQRNALEKELEANAEPIERELDLQHAALTAVGEQMKTDLQQQLLQRESKEVVLPFAADSFLPGSWAQDRKDVLQASVAVASVSSAADAAKKLKLSFVSLVEGRFAGDDLPALISDINRVVTIIDEIQGKQEAASPQS